MNISVCIASYNGEKYIKTQLNSIINQLEINDEIIIVDDCSTDKTIEIIESIMDYRITVFKNNFNMGHVYSFNRAIELSSNDIVFMSDQDDIWKNGRVLLMKKNLLDSKSLLLSSNSEFINSEGVNLDYNTNGVNEIYSTNYFNNIIDIFFGKTNYYGCLMVFKKELKKIILPIPGFVESHDLWIAMAANLLSSNTHCNDITLSRRIHQNNASIVNRNIFLKLKSRWIFLISLFVLLFRRLNKN